jgi:hypothetical protein
VDHDAAYWARRVGVSLGALVATLAGAIVMRFGVQGVFISKSGALVNTLLVVAVAICTAVAAVRTWTVCVRGKSGLSGWMAEEKSVGPMLIIGFVGTLAAYFLRSLFEAPGERRKRAAYELAVATYARRRTPAAGQKQRQKASSGGGRKRR